jgi:hypothetical protein
MTLPPIDLTKLLDNPGLESKKFEKEREKIYSDQEVFTKFL